MSRPRVLDGDNGLSGEKLHQLDLLVAKRSDLLAEDDDSTDQHLVLEHWHPDDAARASQSDEKLRVLRIVPVGVTDDEIKTILGAALAIKVRSESDAARRWCPWLAAYSGARMGELTQLRGADIIQQDGVHAMKILPEAGTTKTGRARNVPLHEHLIGQGFFAFVEINGKGPLFYNEPEQTTTANDPTNPRKPRFVKARERVAGWVRGLGVSDPELSPNHAWRHTFKATGFRSGI